MNDIVIYLICRGRTINDDLPRPLVLGRGLDSALADKEALKPMACSMGERSLDAIYTSPAGRALATASLISQASFASVRINSALEPVNRGTWEGRPVPEIMTESADEYAAFQRDPVRCRCGGGESMQAVRDRVVRFLRQCVQQHDGEHIALVTHADVIRAAIAGVVGLPLDRARDIDQTPGCINVIRGIGNEFTVGAVNQTVVPEEVAFC